MRRLAAASLAVALLAAAGGPSVAAPAQAGASLGEVRKQHNIDQGDGTFAVQLTAPAETWGLRGHTIAVVVFFHDAAGNPVRSNLPGYADASGQLRVVSLDATVLTDPEGMDFVFRLPYAAFPRRAEGRYQVEGRVRLLDRFSGGRTVLASTTVRFFVE